MTSTRVAFVTLARGTFDISYASDIRRRSLDMLGHLEGVSVTSPDDLLIEPDDARRVAQQLAADKPDLLIIQNGTFALGNLAIELAQLVPAPILLWAVTEPPMEGGALRSNSLVGVNVNASNLHKLGFRPRFIYGLPEDEPIRVKIGQAIRAAAAIRTLNQTTIGMVGSHAIGFYDLDVEELELRRRLGVNVRSVGLEDAFKAAHELAADEVGTARADLEQLYPVRDEVSQEQVELMARQFGGLRKIAQVNQFNGLTVRCWPEWAAQYGIAACGSVSTLNTAGITTGCEGDVDGAVTMILGEAVSGQRTYLADFITADPSDNTAFFWHIGCAACQLSAPNEPRQLQTHFAGGKGVTAGFTLKPGRVTIARIGHQGSEYRLFLTTGEAISTELVVRGVLMRLRFDHPVQQILDLIMHHGIEHHFCVIYGDVTEELRAFAHWKGLPVLMM